MCIRDRSRGANPGTDSQFPANCAGNSVSVPGLRFAGYEKLRLQLWNKTPKYGNDDDYADGILRTVFDAFHDEIDGRPNTKGGVYRVNYLSTTCHVYFGSVTEATPDGRRAWEPLSDCLLYTSPEPTRLGMIS